MMSPDYFEIQRRDIKKGVVELSPTFIVKSKSKDLMIRGQDFYAVWDNEEGLWSKSEDVVIRQVDSALEEKKNYIQSKEDCSVIVRYMWDGSSGSIDKWHKYVQKQMRDSYQPLDEKVTFFDDKADKKKYSSKRLPYSLTNMDIPNYEELASTLYAPEEREKFEWLIGSVLAGDSKDIQKFCVFHGDPGTGKSTILNIVQMLFDGYWTVIDFKELTGKNNQFALETIANDPLVVIQHDADLSRISDATLLNSLVSHETMSINEKYKRKYNAKFNAIIFIGTNRYVKIPEAKSGIIRRLLDIYPTGNKIKYNHYRSLCKNVAFELGGIAAHCLEVYKSRGPEYYNDYIPTRMVSATNELYDFVEDAYFDLVEKDPIDLNTLYTVLYKNYCSRNDIRGMFRLDFKKEIGNYYRVIYPEKRINGKHRRMVYEGFIKNKFSYTFYEKKEEPSWLTIDVEESLFDRQYVDAKAQYAKKDGTPKSAWSNVKSTLENIDTAQTHYILLPEENHIVIDFDLKNATGNKDKDLNIEAASKFPPTYAEFSNGGSGVHLHYIYDGDVNSLDRLFDTDIEIKVFKGKASLRRRLSLCNDIPVATISSGLPLKKGGKKQMLNEDSIKDEKHLRSLINKALRKEIHADTSSNVDFIKKILDDAQSSGMVYDVRDLREKIAFFAMDSTNQSERCMEQVSKMQFSSSEESFELDTPPDVTSEEQPIIFYDVEVFPNLLLINWKFEGAKTVTRMINPKPEDVKDLFKYRLVGYNNRRYDNHIIYARGILEYSNAEIFRLSQRIVGNDKSALFGQAYNLSYADVYDFSSKKQGLKKWEIELDIHHKELGLAWNEPVPEEDWPKVAEYCDNDVIATEVVFNHLKEDFAARKVLAKLSGLTVNDTTRQHATKIIFGDDRKPNLIYTDLSETFPGYSFERGKSSYMGEDPSEGGYVYAEPGVYGNVTVLDITSMHPSSILAMNMFGDYTDRFREIVEARIAVKKHDTKQASKLLGGALAEFLGTDDEMDQLAYALKIIINSVYGYTAASFANPFKDKRNIDNIVAKRGALFMITLKNEVQNRGYTVAHIKTDSIKIPDADDKIIEFVKEFGERYGYSFVCEAVYDKFCLVNDSVYIAKYSYPEELKDEWEAVGAEFQHPIIFKTLFSKEKISFKDYCETKNTSTALYLDMNENLPEDEHNNVFVGRVGQFIPVKDGYGGGVLLREQGDKLVSVAGTKGYRWVESETVKNGKDKNIIDKRYYDKLVENAISHISEYTDFEWFVGDTPYKGALPFHESMNPPIIDN